MPRIFDNIELDLLPALRETLDRCTHADFTVGYFNLRGWKSIDDLVGKWAGGPDQQCRLLIGMQRLPQEELRSAFSLTRDQEQLDNQTALRLKQKLAEDFRNQLCLGAPNNLDEAGLRRLAAQLKDGKVVVKLFLGHLLHAKLYLLFRKDPINPIIGFLGSSNLTQSGLSRQGELNVDVLDHDATTKLARWFEDRWNDRWCIDITAALIEVIENSWAREELLPPYQIYVKMAYHLAQEARAGLSEFRIPPEFRQRLFDYQVAAVKIAAHHLNKRGGVLIGDVVGLGKTLMATALAKVFQDDHFTETLIICPKNLVKMWKDYVAEYRLLATVLSLTSAATELPSLRRYRVVLIDESQNLRNRDGKRYRAIQEYIQENESKCILLSATPYNKTYLDLSNQLRLFVPEGQELAIRPERLLREIGETEFIRRHQCPVRSLAAFENSNYADDWRELMRLYMVRRTRSFIQDNYATLDPATGRKFLTFEDGTRSYFPERVPKTVRFKIDDANPADQYAQLYASDVVTAVNALKLPRYGLANYVAASPNNAPTQTEAKHLDDLSRAGKRLMGFCRTNLFKRLESSGEAFQQSIERHILRNQVFIHAIEHDLPLPIGTQDSGLLDTGNYDEDFDDENAQAELYEEGIGAQQRPATLRTLRTIENFKTRAAKTYNLYRTRFKSRFKWLPSGLFISSLATDLAADAGRLLEVLTRCGNWDPKSDSKLDALFKLLNKKHPKEKVLIFTQFADTVRYLAAELHRRGLKRLAGVTGEDDDPTSYAWRFSPDSNKKRDQVTSEQDLRILVATDVLSEGQNLQDAAIVVNYDLPWAIIRLIQRAGRVDRIGQKSEKILCYSFLPADGVERLIRLRARVRQRLHENAEVVGTDEAFFEDEGERKKLLDLYNEKSGILDGEAEADVDLASFAYQIWKNAIDRFPQLQKTIPELPPVVYSTRPYQATDRKPHGVLLYVRTAEANDALAWVDTNGNSITESQFDASVMLNRLMFIYFMQKKGFLDGDLNYLQNRLERCRKEKGSDKFYSFYRYFLVRLFREGLGGRKRDAALEKLIGRVPYLNGGIFDIHELEAPDRYGKTIQIPDKAFEGIFKYFDQYQWHLDERPLRADNEINPDVLGYIFEKYINQKQMGAYYTKEDITEYISKNTVLPFLFDAAKPKCKIAFENPGGPTLWDMLRQDPNRYINEALRWGMDQPLPATISAGIKSASKRDNWNSPAPQEYALPTETWREVVARRTQCDELRRKLAAGEIHEINDLITLNLDIRQFAQDAIENCEGPELLRAFWQAIERITILDPTCGSGAFLFAALNILEALYEACLDRMESFVEDAAISGETTRLDQFSDFRQVLDRVAAHPNRRYFIFKSIILNNLFGVDIMEEAVEICKLRLFLKLAAQVSPNTTSANLGIEPLPDIDFNIRAGNTLVGFARYDDVKNPSSGTLDFDNAKDKIAAKAADLQKTVDAFRQQQTDDDRLISASNKAELNQRLKTLDNELNGLLASEYGIKHTDKTKYAAWTKSHQPFHWFIEFHGIMAKGGFDVIIGNPPYVVNTPEKVHYEIKEDLFKTYSCKNLYAFVCERSIHLAHQKSSLGLIVQLTLLSSERMAPLQDLLIQRGFLALSSFPRRPESIFDGVEMPVTIFISRSQPSKMFTTRVNRFYTDERPSALSTMKFANHASRLQGHRIGKLGSDQEIEIFHKLDAAQLHLKSLTAAASRHMLYYQEACRYWAKASFGMPFFKRDGEHIDQPHGRTVAFATREGCAFATCLMNSSLFYWFYSGFSDCEHINDALIKSFKVPASWAKVDWISHETKLSKSLKAHSQKKTIITKQGYKIEYAELDASQSKKILDEIDKALAKLYGLSEEQYDFIINYDIKYRLGRENEVDEEE